jgi:hypothetical protein
MLHRPEHGGQRGGDLLRVGPPTVPAEMREVEVVVADPNYTPTYATRTRRGNDLPPCGRQHAIDEVRRAFRRAVRCASHPGVARPCRRFRS